MLQEFKSLEAVLKDIKKLQEAYKILEKVYVDLSPYMSGPIKPETIRDMNAFFEFDDSE